MTTNDTPDLAAVIAEKSERLGKCVFHMVRDDDMAAILAAASLAQELTALLGDEPVGRVKALIEQDARLKRVANFAGTTGDKLDEELQLADDAARRAALAEKDEHIKTLRRLYENTMTCHEEASNLAHSRGIELERLRERVAELEEQATMACIEPREGCQCAGCLYARDAHAKTETS